MINAFSFSADHPPHRIDHYLVKQLPDYSRSKITSWIKSGDALINEKIFKPKDKANGNEIVTIEIHQKENINWIPEKIPLDIVFEDDDILVINKPFGLVTHPGAGNWNGTLANALLTTILIYQNWIEQA